MKKLIKQLWVNALPGDLFSPNISLDRARELFAHYVDLVEIENHSFCNRVCWFCPNAFIDRRSHIWLSREQDFERIVADLKEIAFSRTLAWSRYHEPLAHESIFARIRKAREELPQASLAMVSNGDYLNKETLARLGDTGLNRLMLDLYLPDGKEEDEKELERSVEKFAVRTGLSPVQAAAREYVFPGFAKIKITMGVPNYKAESISTRGGLLQIPKAGTYKRTAACLAPIRHVVVDYNNKGMLCCQVRSDASDHASAVIGDLGDPNYGLFHLYRDMASARLALVEPGPKTGVCQSCDISAASNEGVYFSQKLHAFLAGVPGMRALSAYATRRFSRFG